MSRCSIVPPHILSTLAGSGRARPHERAAHTLDLDTALRRSGRRPLSPPEPGVVRAAAAVGPQRTIHDAGGAEELPGSVVRSEGDGPTGDAAADEAYDGLGLTWELWHEAYGRDSLDGAGLPLLATVHYGDGYENAFWDGSRMVFGDGDGEIFTRFTASLDVIGHELAHGVTQSTSELEYQGQSGALNEHVSDVFGVLVKQRHLGQDAADADWLIGAELLTEGVQGDALRSMAAPGTAYDDPRMGSDPQPAHMRDYVETREDNGGVHINSGIPNKAFHLVATSLGGPAWETPGLVWFDVITGDIAPDCDFATFAGLTVAAAESRYGSGSTEVTAVRSAWDEVGVAADEGGGAPPASEGAPSGASVVLTRSGGVAGMRLSREVNLTDIPEPDARALRSLLDDPELARWAEEKPARPDAFCYGLRCEEPPVDVQLDEAVLSIETRDLFQRTLRRDP